METSDINDASAAVGAALYSSSGVAGADARLPQRKKRPGPKRDSKPAPSEKLERNRQAQRTHRERKEQYTKDLELEVLRLKDLYIQVAREKDAVAHERDQAIYERQIALDEIQRLRAANGAAATLSGTESVYGDATRSSVFSGSVEPDGRVAVMSDDESVTGMPNRAQNGFGQDLTSIMTPSDYRTTSVSQRSNSALASPESRMELSDAPAQLDYDEIGLDFVLTLERPCMPHSQFLTVRAHNPDGPVLQNGHSCERPPDVPDDGENSDISGHVMMATVPPLSHVTDEPSIQYPHQLPDLQRADLVRLLNMSQQLPYIAEHELPPVRAWLRILQAEGVNQLTRADFETLKAELISKVVCLRFGAVIYETDVEQAVSRIVAAKTPGSVSVTLSE